MDFIIENAVNLAVVAAFSFLAFSIRKGAAAFIAFAEESENKIDDKIAEQLAPYLEELAEDVDPEE